MNRLIAFSLLCAFLVGGLLLAQYPEPTPEQLSAIYQRPVQTITTQKPTTTTTEILVRVASVEVAYSGPHACGGDLPPCWVMMLESKGDPNAYNPTGCNGRGCYGKWQCDPRTCDGTGSEAEQDAEARRVWNNGHGCSHWNAC